MVWGGSRKTNPLNFDFSSVLNEYVGNYINLALTRSYYSSIEHVMASYISQNKISTVSSILPPPV